MAMHTCLEPHGTCSYTNTSLPFEEARSLYLAILSVHPMVFSPTQPLLRHCPSSHDGKASTRETAWADAAKTLRVTSTCSILVHCPKLSRVTHFCTMKIAISQKSHVPLPIERPSSCFWPPVTRMTCRSEVPWGWKIYDTIKNHVL